LGVIDRFTRFGIEELAEGSPLVVKLKIVGTNRAKRDRIDGMHAQMTPTGSSTLLQTLRST
jgi:hypothetical protein